MNTLIWPITIKLNINVGLLFFTLLHTEVHAADVKWVHFFSYFFHKIALDIFMWIVSLNRTWHFMSRKTRLDISHELYCKTVLDISCKMSCKTGLDISFELPHKKDLTVHGNFLLNGLDISCRLYKKKWDLAFHMNCLLNKAQQFMWIVSWNISKHFMWIVSLRANSFN